MTINTLETSTKAVQAPIASTTKKRSTFKTVVHRIQVTAFVAYMLIAAVFGAAFLAGFELVPVLSGSMEPTIMTGDYIVTAPLKEIEPLAENDFIGSVLAPLKYDEPLKAGDIVSMDWDASENFPAVNVTHRIESIDDAGTLTTKGDNNPVADDVHTEISDVTGVVVFTVEQPYAGVLDQFVPSDEWKQNAVGVATTDPSAFPTLADGAPWGWVFVFAWLTLLSIVKRIVRVFRKND